jgi:hypothetical protein
MQLNLEEPESIVKWWRICPERHWLYLEALEVQSPQFRGAIRHARHRIEADSMFSRRRVEALADELRSAWDPGGESLEQDMETELH